MLRFCQQVANVFKSMSHELELINTHNVPYITLHLDPGTVFSTSRTVSLQVFVHNQ